MRGMLDISNGKLTCNMCCKIFISDSIKGVSHPKMVDIEGEQRLAMKVLANWILFLFNFK